MTFRASPFVRPALLALTLGLLGSSGAQSGTATQTASLVATPPTAPTFCTEDLELYVELEVGGRNRGTRLVYPEGEALWVEAAALTPSEAGYVAAQKDCNGVAFVRLNPTLRTRLDGQALSLVVEANPALLGTTTYRVGTGQVSYASDLPLLRLSYSVAAAADVSRGVDTAAMQVAVQYWRGNLRLEGSARLAGGQGRTPGTVYGARADYDLSPSWQVGAFADAGSGEERFGVRSSLSRLVLRDVGPIELDFPSDAEVQVTVDGETRTAFLAPAGHLVLTDVRAKYTSGTVAVRWTDGVREGQSTFPYRQASALQPGSFGVTGEVAWNTRAGLEANVEGRYVLTPQVSLQAGFEQSNGTPRASLGAVWQDGEQGANLNASTDFGVRPSGAPSAEGVGTRVQAGYAARTGPVTFGLSSTWTVTPAGTDPRRSEARLVAAYNRSSLEMYASVAYSLSRELSGRVGLDYRPTAAALLSASADMGREGVRFRVRGRFMLGSGRSVAVEGRPGPGFAAEYTQAIDNDLLRLNVQNLAPYVAGTYTLNRGISATASVNSSGQGAVSVTGSVSRVAGQLTWNSTRDGSVLFLKTGVPGLTLRVNGQPQGRTDAAGDVVLTGFRAGLPLQLSFDPSELPIEVGYRQDRVGLLPDRAGVNELDWRENFTVSRWVTLRWAEGHSAAGATLEVAGQVFTADDEGAALLPPLPAGVPALLRSEDGTQRCHVVTGPKGEVPACGS
ncbi:hypothetical protein [Deinococcus hopiensis]|uniref:Outer membrane usher protein FimD/PapC n=1 Tax=Deinococcus hopiensis KR-140 TaxID=695939 RepID=A0A1W1UDY2_9DEIO|nr:hypothetical protein [Deinococcus hopiensis]SMB79242.1 Outer membrane usher protein FimD/PapC [Deinococcus hopiensis KR-140]